MSTENCCPGTNSPSNPSRRTRVPFALRGFCPLLSDRSPRHTFSYPILSAYRFIAQTIEPPTVKTNFIMPDFSRARHEHHVVGNVAARAAGAHRAAHAGASGVSSEMAGVVDRHRAGARSSAGDFTWSAASTTRCERTPSYRQHASRRTSRYRLFPAPAPGQWLVSLIQGGE